MCPLQEYGEQQFLGEMISFFIKLTLFGLLMLPLRRLFLKRGPRMFFVHAPHILVPELASFNYSQQRALPDESLRKSDFLLPFLRWNLGLSQFQIAQRLFDHLGGLRTKDGLQVGKAIQQRSELFASQWSLMLLPVLYIHACTLSAHSRVSICQCYYSSLVGCHTTTTVPSRSWDR